MICETFAASTSAAIWPQSHSQSVGVPLNLVMRSSGSLVLMLCFEENFKDMIVFYNY